MKKASPDNNYCYNKKLQSLAQELRNSMTKAEVCLWKYSLKAKKMNGYQFTRQRPVLDYIADFMCKELMLIIEVDGISHKFDSIEKKDRLRQTKLEQAGFDIIRFKDEEILNNIDDVINTIEAFIKQKEV